MKKNYFNFSNVNALVTGSSGNLGSEISMCLAEHGANVFLNGRNKKKILHIVEDMYKWMQSNKKKLKKYIK